MARELLPWNLNVVFQVHYLLYVAHMKWCLSCQVTYRLTYRLTLEFSLGKVKHYSRGL